MDARGPLHTCHDSATTTALWATTCVTGAVGDDHRASLPSSLRRLLGGGKRGGRAARGGWTRQPQHHVVLPVGLRWCAGRRRRRVPRPLGGRVAAPGGDLIGRPRPSSGQSDPAASSPLPRPGGPGPSRIPPAAVDARRGRPRGGVRHRCKKGVMAVRGGRPAGRATARHAGVDGARKLHRLATGAATMGTAVGRGASVSRTRRVGGASSALAGATPPPAARCPCAAAPTLCSG